MGTSDSFSITKEEAVWLINQLNEKSVAFVSFNNMIKAFNNYIRRSYKLFAFGICFVELLHRFELFPGRSQRLMTVVLLLELFRNGENLSGCIFSQYLAEIIDPEKRRPALGGIKSLDTNEISFIVQLLNRNYEVLDFTPNDVINDGNPIDYRGILSKLTDELCDGSFLHGSLEDRMRLPLIWTISTNSDDLTPDTEDLFLFTVNLMVTVVKKSADYLKPTMIRLPPPPLDGDLVEIPWHFSSAKHILPPFHKKNRPTSIRAFDVTFRRPKANYFRDTQYSFIKRLLVKQQIPPDEINCLVDLILNAASESNFLSTITKIDKGVFVQLIVANGDAAKVLVVSSFTFPLFGELLSTLVDISTFRSLEVVKELCNEKNGNEPMLPGEFVCKYIENFIQKMIFISVGEDPTDSTCGKGRWVRLLCAFILSVYKQKIFDLRPIMQTIQAFSCEHVKIKEGQSLYKAIRNLED